MLGKRPNKVYDPFLKARLGYQNPERLKKAIVAQPKMYDGERLQITELIIDSPDYEETLKDAEVSRLNMKNKMIHLNYAKLNALYETFVPQKEFSTEQTYFSTPSTFNVSSESSKEISYLPTPKMPNESKLLKLFDEMDKAILALRTDIDATLLEDKRRIYIDDGQNTLRKFYKTNVIPMSLSLIKGSKELKQEITEEWIRAARKKRQKGFIPFLSKFDATKRTSSQPGIMEIEPDIENMTLNEYWEYEAEKESSTFNYPYSHDLPPPHPCSLPVQPYPKNYFVSTNVRNDVNIKYVDLEEDQEEDGDDGDIFYMWDIMVEDVEQIRQFLTPNVPDVMHDIIQPLILKTINTTPLDEDYVAPATKSILDDLLDEFRDEILNVTMVDEGAECSPTKDLEELERILTKNHQSHYTEIQEDDEVACDGGCCSRK
ncbi:hypothetical protein Tco_0313951 [Tanacetum coccineum]